MVREGPNKKDPARLSDKIAVADEWISRGYATAIVLKIIGIAESTYYHQKKPHTTEQRKRTGGGRPIPGYSLDRSARRISDKQVKEWLIELVLGEEHAYGYRKLAKSLAIQHGLIVNKKKVHRLCKELGILKKQRQISLNYPRRKLARNRLITSVNQLWESDVKYGYIAGEDRFFYFMGIIDVYDRMIIDYHIGLTCEGRHAAHLLERALWKRKLLNTT